MDLKPYIRNLRDQIEHSLRYEDLGMNEYYLGELDDFLQNPNKSDLEKAFFLVLNQFPGSNHDYLIRPSEIVLIPDIYDMGVPGIEYEIDFALYGGSIKDPVKVAIEVDGQRSHGQKHVNKDRRKDTNLQAAGWLVMRFNSKEVHAEIMKFSENEHYISPFLTSIENVIQEKLQLVTGNNYGKHEVRSKLTGYTWGEIECTHCGKSRSGILNRKKQHCNFCKKKFERKLQPHERVRYEHQGLWFFE